MSITHIHTQKNTLMECKVGVSSSSKKIAIDTNVCAHDVLSNNCSDESDRKLCMVVTKMK